MKERLTTEYVVEQFIAIHGNKYDYEKVDYKSTLTKVIIICRHHGEFLQLPKNHKKGRGCHKCQHDGMVKAAALVKVKIQHKKIKGKQD